MPKLNESYREVPHTVRGIPCIIAVTHYVCVEGDTSTWDSDWDYHGYTECEWRILDRKGYLAPWLERKLSQYNRQDIEARIAQWMSEQGRD